MIRKNFQAVLMLVVALYSIAVLLAIWLRVPYSDVESSYYKTYKDILPLIIATPAAYLALAFQRRISYLQALRTLWCSLVGAISSALTYTETNSPSQEQYLLTLTKLSAGIEEIRGFFENIPSEEAGGWYPYEPLKQIHDIIRRIGYENEATKEKRTIAKDQIYQMWKSIRTPLLAELDRNISKFHHAQYAIPVSKVHDQSVGRDA